jgi:hypothetical protein
MTMLAKTNDVCVGFCVVCECWMTGTIMTGAANVLVNKFPVSTISSIIQGACGHTGTLLPTTKNIANKSPMGTLGSQIYGIFNGSVYTGSPNVRSL